MNLLKILKGGYKELKDSLSSRSLGIIHVLPCY